MAMLEQFLEQMLGGTDQDASPVGGLINALFHGVPGGMNASGVGSLADLVRQFEQVGLGHVIQSWIGNSENIALLPDQLRQVLGNEKVDAMARAAGLDPDTLLTQLSQLMPGLVDRMTPDGRLPTDTH